MILPGDRIGSATKQSHYTKLRDLRLGEKREVRGHISEIETATRNVAVGANLAGVKTNWNPVVDQAVRRYASGDRPTSLRKTRLK